MSLVNVRRCLTAADFFESSRTIASATFMSTCKSAGAGLEALAVTELSARDCFETKEYRL